METSAILKAQTLNPSICSPVASPAKISAKPESAAALRALAAAFGLSSPALLGKFDPDGSCLRTCQASLLCPEQWEEYAESWPDSAMWDSTSVYALQTSGPLTSGSGCSLWPTAVSQDDQKTPEAHLRMKQRMGERDGTFSNRTAITSLSVKVQTWPTARQEDGESCGNHPGAVDSLTGAAKTWSTPHAHNASGPPGAGTTERGGHAKDLVREALSIWQTPATDSFRSRGGDRKGEQGLDQQARMFPTPAARDYRPPNLDPEQHEDQLQNFVEHQCPSPPDHQMEDGPQSSESGPTSRRRLNPRFVEWLQNFPVTWTEIP